MTTKNESPDRVDIRVNNTNICLLCHLMYYISLFSFTYLKAVQVTKLKNVFLMHF